MARNVSEGMRGTVGCGITKQTMMMTFSKVHRSKILGEIKRQGEKKKLPSHIREQTRGQRGFQMSDRFDKLQVAFKLFNLLQVDWTSCH